MTPETTNSQYTKGAEPPHEKRSNIGTREPITATTATNKATTSTKTGAATPWQRPLYHNSTKTTPCQHQPHL
ncbi:hypothetical protein L484_023918 [Morus notabilis]|uniref:Uncharacterized protein n=1 Tax=Morus notabilis TaxID=981085 RepID=W9R0C2_9ROSA|nr:hypothetical protein L484_023918 [Morus notabilis]